jgi:outer membrane protein OmpA-like peptidoglycan-associated protein
VRPATFSAFAALAVGAGAGASQALADESGEGAGDRKEPGVRNNAATPHAWLRSPAAEAYAPSAQQQATEEAPPAANENSGGALLTTDELSGNSADEGRTFRAPVATAFAPSLTASQETCMGSRSFGMQAIGFGLSVATTWPDRQCRRIRNARALEEFGYRSAALALLCQDEEVFDAMQRAGTPCPGSQLLDFPLPPQPTPEPELAEPPLMRLQNVLFDFDRSNLRPEADAILMPVLDMLQRDPSLSVDIEGHADWMGSDDYNIRLSQRRAQAVVDWLVARGIARERLVAVGKGEREPIATNDTAEGRQLNRRVEVRRR